MEKKKSDHFSTKLIHSVYDEIPAFTDVFDEDTFYMFVVFFVAITIVVVCVLSRFVTIKAVD